MSFGQAMVFHPVIELLKRNFPHSPEFSGGVWHSSSKASTGKNLQVEQPVACG
jgi:hypothetical protein